jgi:hypothetical protein
MTKQKYYVVCMLENAHNQRPLRVIGYSHRHIIYYIIYPYSICTVQYWGVYCISSQRTDCTYCSEISLC